MNYSKILGTGSYLPKRILTNQTLAKKIDTNDKWIIEKTGIRQRHIANTKETTAFMATEAAKKALQMADVNHVDMILVATTTPESFFPSTACVVQAALDLSPCAAFDVGAACAGFNYALTIADQFIRSGQCQRVLVIGSEVMSRVMNWQDRSTCILFGDGAGAVVLGTSQTPGIMASHLHADGKYQDLLYLKNVNLGELSFLKMQGAAVFRQAVTKMRDTLTHILETQQIDIHTLDWFIPHQANLRIIKSLAKKLDLIEERIVITIDTHANTSSASVPLALDTAIRDHRIRPGQLLLLESFGGGITWGATLLRY